MPIAPYLEELHSDVMKIHRAYPNNPCTEELAQCIKNKLNDIKEEQARIAVAIEPVVEETEEAAAPTPVVIPLISAAPEEDLRDIGFLNDNLENINEVAQTRPLEPAEEENLRTILNNIANTKNVEPETAEFTSFNLGVPKNLVDIATNPNIPPELAEQALETLTQMT